MLPRLISRILERGPETWKGHEMKEGKGKREKKGWKRKDGKAE